MDHEDHVAQIFHEEIVIIKPPKLKSAYISDN